MDKFDAVFDGEPVNTPAATPEPAPAPVVEAAPPATPEPSADGQPRAPDGKFASKTAEAPPAEPTLADPAQPPATPEPAAPAEPDELTKARSTIDALNKALTQERAHRRQQASTPPPDPQADPAGFEQHQEREQALTFEWSFKALALTQGQDIAKSVAEWARDLSGTDPSFYERALSSPDPAGFAFAEYRRDQVMQRMMDPDFFTKFESFTAPANNPNPAPAVTVAPPSPPSTPPRSLVSAPNAGGAQPGAIPTGPGAAFDSVFRK